MVRNSIGFVSGCFDWLSPGHTRLLKEAKSRCNTLHMLMADDQTVRYYKGKGRPLLTFYERVELIHACKYVDKVWELHKLPDFTNQVNLIKCVIKPDIYFEGIDATDKDIQSILTELKIKRVTLNTEPLHIADILRRYDARRYDATITEHESLMEIAGL